MNIIKKPQRLLILDGLENPGNIGTILRSCDGAHFDGVLIVNERTRVNQYKVIKASMGGAFTIPWYHFNDIESCYNFVHKLGMNLFLAHPGTESHPFTDEKIALVIGNERFGISKQWFKFQHKTVSLPMLGCCDSLNAGVAASILIYRNIGSA
ncbi:MAG: RNA methyltransferase [Clostridia bacterium]|nr:RNA methyltransferase [Clostridia bacterium]